MEKLIGVVSIFFGKINVAAIKLSGVLKVGDKIKIKGATTDFETEVKSMQIDGKIVKSAKIGDDVGVKVPEKVRPNDKVFKI